MADHDRKVTRRDILDLTFEFVETWFHQILYQREIYPRDMFELMRKFGVPVHIAWPEPIRDYLSNFVKTCYPFLEKGDVKYISLIVLENNEPVEKFVFEINSYLQDMEIDLSQSIIMESESIYTLADLEQHFRACLIKINAIQPRRHTTTSSSDSVEIEKSFSLTLERIHDGYPEKSKEQDIDWIPATESYNWKHIIPLKSVPMDLFTYNTFIMDTTSRKGKEKCP